MRHLIAAALLWASPACAQEAGPPAERPPLTAEEKAEIARLLDDEGKRGGRGRSPWKPGYEKSLRGARIVSQEPPSPDLMDHPCDAFDEGHELVELKLVSDYSPVPVGILVPAPYLPGHRVRTYRAEDLDALFLMNAYHHDFAPYDMRHQFYSLDKTPNDELGMLIRGGEGGGGESLDLLARRFAGDSVLDEASIDLREKAKVGGFDDQMGIWQIKLKTNSQNGSWIGFADDGSVTDLIACPRGDSNHRCWHEMAFGSLRPRVTYDYTLVSDWQQIRAMTETFFGCARAAFLTERGKS